MFYFYFPNALTPFFDYHDLLKRFKAEWKEKERENDSEKITDALKIQIFKKMQNRTQFFFA